MGKLDTFFRKSGMKFAFPSAALLALNLLGLLPLCEKVLPSYSPAIQDRRQSCILTLECSN